MRSQFNAQTLAEIFRDLFLVERSGELVLSKDSVEKRVYFDRGLIFFAQSDAEGEDLARTLVRDGELSPGALAEARLNLDSGSDARELAQVLLNRELISRRALRATGSKIVDSVVQSVFAWEGGGAKFCEGHTPAGLFETTIVSTAEVILKGIVKMSGFRSIHDAMRALDNRLLLRDPSPLPLEHLTLSPAHGFILSRIDGNTNLGEVISILPPGEEEQSVRFLFGLLILGVLDYDPRVGKGAFKVGDILRDHADRQALEGMQEASVRQIYALIRSQNPHEMLGVHPGASLMEIEQAYEQMKSQFSRDKLLPKVRETFKDELALVESRLVESFLTLTRPDPGNPGSASRQALAAMKPMTVDDLNVRVEMDKATTKKEIEKAAAAADAYYAKARRCIREGDFHNAIQYAKLAISQNSSDARYFFLLAECQARNPEARWQRLAEDNFAKATQLDPWNSHYWISLGRFYKQRGLSLRARKQFEEALKLVPNSVEVIRELESLG